MTPRLLPWRDDPIQPAEPSPLTITVDGVPVPGVVSQSLAGVILASGTVGFRRTSHDARPRGVFCGIGVCYDCLVDVNGLRDVRACQRRAADGDVVVTQYDPLPTPAESRP
ncbi:MAG TPA: (2Fe-2S)-binding protein [Terrimesophilobacter sp.]|nr:(2Fe-2S)-binding protein [Terrimesophilobacter sp.]